MTRRRAREAALAYAFLSPALAVFVVFVFYPFGRNFWLAVYQTPPFPGLPRRRVGLDQVRDVLDLGSVGGSLARGLVPGVAVAILAAGVAVRKVRPGAVDGGVVRAAAGRALRWGGLGAIAFATAIFLRDSESGFADSLWVTIAFALMTVPAGIALGLALALVAHQRLRGIGFYRTVFSSTVATSVAVASVIFGTLLNPTVGLLPWLGLQTQPPILSDPRWALPAVAVTTVWQNLGLSFILMSAGLQAVPEDLIEAARVDGARRMARLWHVTLPMLSPTLMFAAVVGGILAFQSFGQIDLLTQGGPLARTNVLTYSIYTTMRERQDEGRAAVLAIALFAVTFVLTLFQMRALERRVFYAR